ncbi:cell wall hydrolase [Parasphingorhabdus sp.]|uniref:cell wall hydrolase n=1 Tax=Parasphingorhabdus sp. TaxID=2709688 RepID=UPI002F9253A8
MRVPPPYVPQLSTSGSPVAGPAGYRLAPSVESAPPPAPKAGSTAPLPSWLRLNLRERILFGLVILSLGIAAAIMPQTELDARQNHDISIIAPLAKSDVKEFSNLPTSSLRDSASLIEPAVFKASLTDNARALHCLTSAIYYEAGLEPDAGQRAVAQVVLNRVRHPSYPSTICGVVFQGSERVTGCQFSYTCDGSLNRTPSKSHWARAQKVAALALAGKVEPTVVTATHYHTTKVHPYWASSLHSMGTIGAHRFYSWKGNAGKPGAFQQIYRGGEPLPIPNLSKSSLALAPPLDPIDLEKAYEAGLRKAVEENRQSERAQAIKANAIEADSARRHGLPVPPSSEKALADQSLPDDSQIKPEYRNSGTWIVKPAA